MKKIHFLLAMSIVLVSGCRHKDGDDHHYPPDSPSTFKMILQGPYILVWAKDRPNWITVFSPRDHLHEFYSNNVLQEHGLSQKVHLTLAADGVASAGKLLVDPYFPRDFVIHTEIWAPPDDYLVKIDLPLPEKITFASPLHPVILENGTRRFMATNFILEYRVTDFEKIKVTSNELGSLRPLSVSALQKQYEMLCQRPDVQEKYYDFSESCANMRNLLQQSAGSGTAVFFFGVGIPLKKQLEMNPEEIEAHAVNFFNNVMPQSFPKWKGPRLGPKGAVAPRDGGGSTPMLKGAVAPQYPGGSTPMLMEMSFRPAPYLRTVPVNAFYTAVIDCKAGNVIVTAQTTQ